jgi:GR25 family glycosyltransferase involved in LPS biosynthesis
MVINLDKSRNRRRKMRADFAKHNLPEFERVPGVIVTDENVNTMTPPRKTSALKLADYGCALAHRRAWQRVVDGPHEWVVVIEDDAELVDEVDLTDLPLVPVDADMVLFRAGTIMRWAPVCTETEV